jgi:hypothetical protein
MLKIFHIGIQGLNEIIYHIRSASIQNYYIQNHGRGAYVMGVSAVYTFKLNKSLLS